MRKMKANIWMIITKTMNTKKKKNNTGFILMIHLKSDVI